MKIAWFKHMSKSSLIPRKKASDLLLSFPSDKHLNAR